MLDDSTHTTDLEELENEVNRGTFAATRVSTSLFYAWLYHSDIFSFMWGIAGLPLGVYNVVQNLNIPLILQPQLFAFLSLVSWGQVRLSLYIFNGKLT